MSGLFGAAASALAPAPAPAEAAASGGANRRPDSDDEGAAADSDQPSAKRFRWSENSDVSPNDGGAALRWVREGSGEQVDARSDMRIKVGDRVYRVHSYLMERESKFFKSSIKFFEMAATSQKNQNETTASDTAQSSNEGSVASDSNSGRDPSSINTSSKSASQNRSDGNTDAAASSTSGSEGNPQAPTSAKSAKKIAAEKTTEDEDDKDRVESTDDQNTKKDEKKEGAAADGFSEVQSQPMSSSANGNPKLNGSGGSGSPTSAQTSSITKAIAATGSEKVLFFCDITQLLPKVCVQDAGVFEVLLSFCYSTDRFRIPVAKSFLCFKTADVLQMRRFFRRCAVALECYGSVYPLELLKQCDLIAESIPEGDKQLTDTREMCREELTEFFQGFATPKATRELLYQLPLSLQKKILADPELGCADEDYVLDYVRDCCKFWKKRNENAADGSGDRGVEDWESLWGLVRFRHVSDRWLTLAACKSDPDNYIGADAVANYITPIIMWRYQALSSGFGPADADGDCRLIRAEIDPRRTADRQPTKRYRAPAHSRCYRKYFHVVIPHKRRLHDGREENSELMFGGVRKALRKNLEFPHVVDLPPLQNAILKDEHFNQLAGSLSGELDPVVSDLYPVVFDTTTSLKWAFIVTAEVISEPGEATKIDYLPAFQIRTAKFGNHPAPSQFVCATVALHDFQPGSKEKGLDTTDVQSYNVDRAGAEEYSEMAFPPSATFEEGTLAGDQPNPILEWTLLSPNGFVEWSLDFEQENINKQSAPDLNAPSDSLDPWAAPRRPRSDEGSSESGESLRPSRVVLVDVANGDRHLFPTAGGRDNAGSTLFPGGVNPNSGGSLFGGGNNPGGGLFAGGGNNQGGGLFAGGGNSAGGGLFGSGSSSADGPVGSLFGGGSGNSAGGAVGSLFGGGSNPSTSTGGLFGNSSATGGGDTTGGGLFGNNAINARVARTLHHTLFGGNTNTGGARSTSSSGGGLFGNNTNNGGGARNSSTLSELMARTASANNLTGRGTVSGGSLFGNSSHFGSSNNNASDTPMANSTGSLFALINSNVSGAGNSNSTNSLFGNNSNCDQGGNFASGLVDNTNNPAAGRSSGGAGIFGASASPTTQGDPAVASSAALGNNVLCSATSPAPGRSPFAAGSSAPSVVNTASPANLSQAAASATAIAGVSTTQATAANQNAGAAAVGSSNGNSSQSAAGNGGTAQDADIAFMSVTDE